VSGSIELLVGVAILADVPIVVLGVGGVFAQAIDRMHAELLPVDQSGAVRLTQALPMSAGFNGARGLARLDAHRIIDVVLRLAGPDGIVPDLLNIGMTEFECNPVIVSQDGVYVADARLILGNEPPLRSKPLPNRDLNPLFHPKSVAVAGVSTSGRGLGRRALEVYRRLGWEKDLYVLHPTADRITDVPVLRSLSEAPGGMVDYLKVAVPAHQVGQLLAREGGHARVVQLITAGFAELGPEHQGDELTIREAMRMIGTPLVGPNCLGVFCPSGRQGWDLTHTRQVPGSVAIISQSGGLCSDVIAEGSARGLRFSKALSIGNAIDVSPAEVLAYLVDDDETDIIAMYLEGISDTPRFIDALQRARGVKPVLLLTAGLSKDGARATASHTGAMLTDRRLLGALTAGTGLIWVKSLEVLIGALIALQFHRGRAPTSAEASLLVAGHGGGNTALAGDIASLARLPLAQFSTTVVERLKQMPSSLVKNYVNPLELQIGPNEPTASTRATLERILEVQPFTDVLLHCSLRSFQAQDEFVAVASGGLSLLTERIASLGDRLPGAARPYLVTRVPECLDAQERSRLLNAGATAQVPQFFDFGQAVGAIAAVQAFCRERPTDCS
jgi:acyl-CoA synthetase (NDP forming)